MRVLANTRVYHNHAAQCNVLDVQVHQLSCKHTFAFVHLIRKRGKKSGGKKTANGKMLVAIGRRGHVERHRRTLLPKRPLVTTLVDRRPFFDFNDILESSGKQVATPLIKFADDDFFSCSL